MILEIDGQKRRIAVPDHARCVDVGRAPENHIVLSEPTTLSSRHLTIRWSDGWWVQDTSTNGSCLNGNWFRGCTVALNVDDVLELEGHAVIVHHLDEPVGDVVGTERKTSVSRFVLSEGKVEIYPSHGTVVAPIPPQQYRLLAELALRWNGSVFAGLSRDSEFDLLGPIGRDKDPSIRLHQARARLRRWWRNLLTEYPRELAGLPADLIRSDHDGLHLTLDVDQVLIEGVEMQRRASG